MSDGKTMAITGAVLFVIGVIGLGYSLSLQLTAHDFLSAPECSPGTQSADCLQRRPIQVTDTETGKAGEVNAVGFVDNGERHKSAIAFGVYDRSVLKIGASGSATLWHGVYTDLDFAGVDFLTDQSPIGSRAFSIYIGWIGIGSAVILWAASVVWGAMNRRSK